MQTFYQYCAEKFLGASAHRAIRLNKIYNGACEIYRFIFIADCRNPSQFRRQEHSRSLATTRTYYQTTIVTDMEEEELR